MRTPSIDDTALIDALAEVFSRYGYEGANLNRLSEASGLKRASLYYRFPGGKDEIIQAVVDRAAERYEHLLVPAFADGPPRERAAQVAAGLNEYYMDGKASCLIISLAVSEDDERATGGKCVDAWADALMRICADAGLTSAQAEDAALDAIAAIEGGLVILATSGKSGPYRRALASLPDRLTGVPA